MSIWFILGYLAVGYGVMFGVWWLGLRALEHFEGRRRVARRFTQTPKAP